MPVLVVHLLEVVQVKEEKRDALGLGGGPVQRRLEVLVEGTLVREAGQGITSGFRVRQREPALVG